MNSVVDGAVWTWENRWNWKYVATEVWFAVRPGGKLHPAAFFEAKGHLGVEILLFAIIIYLLTRKSFKPNKTKPLTKEEQEELIRDWKPEPLVPKASSVHASDLDTLYNRKKQYMYESAPVIKGNASAPIIQVNGRKAVNLVATNFLNLACSPRIARVCEEALERYGCGSCGPRGFYGTIDVHLELETRMAKFLGTEGAVLYSYDISTPSSAIPAFCKNGDLIVADAGVSYAIQSGVSLTRATVKYFEHNNVHHLLQMLEEIEREDKERNKASRRKTIQRRFIVIEGVYMNYGDVAPLPELLQLKEKYGFRLILDDSLALGVLGKKGKGSAEYHNVDIERIDILLASLGHSIGSVGGICAGSRRVCDHQRLSAAGYVFSASLPPYLASAAITSLDIIEEEGDDLLKRLGRLAKQMREMLRGIPGFKVYTSTSDDEQVPLVHLQLTENRSNAKSLDLLQSMVDGALKEGVYLTIAKYSFLDKSNPPPSLRLAINVDYTEDDLEKSVSIIKKVAKQVLK